MKACLIGVNQEETQAVAPILYFLGIDLVSDPDDQVQVDLFIVGSALDISRLALPVPAIWLGNDNANIEDMMVWCCPIPWRQERILPVLNRLAETPNMPRAQAVNLNIYVRHLESVLIRHALMTTNGVVSKAADLLQIQRTTLIEKMRRYQIDKSEF